MRQTNCFPPGRLHHSLQHPLAAVPARQSTFRVTCITSQNVLSLSTCFPGTNIHGSHPRIPFLTRDKGIYLHPALYGKRTPVHQNLPDSGRRTPTPAIAATRPWYRACWTSPSACMQCVPTHSFGWVLLYVHRNRRLIRDGSPGRPPRPSHSSRALATHSHRNIFTHSTLDQGKPLSAEWIFDENIFVLMDIIKSRLTAVLSWWFIFQLVTNRGCKVAKPYPWTLPFCMAFSVCDVMNKVWHVWQKCMIIASWAKTSFCSSL